MSAIAVPDAGNQPVGNVAQLRPRASLVWSFGRTSSPSEAFGFICSRLRLRLSSGCTRFVTMKQRQLCKPYLDEGYRDSGRDLPGVLSCGRLCISDASASSRICFAAKLWSARCTITSSRRYAGK